MWIFFFCRVDLFFLQSGGFCGSSLLDLVFGAHLHCLSEVLHVWYEASIFARRMHGGELTPRGRGHLEKSLKGQKKDPEVHDMTGKQNITPPPPKRKKRRSCFNFSIPIIYSSQSFGALGKLLMIFSLQTDGFPACTLSCSNLAVPGNLDSVHLGSTPHPETVFYKDSLLKM